TVGDTTALSRRGIWVALRQALSSSQAIYAFGVFDAKKKRLHHICMNQGKDDRGYKDGGIFIKSQKRWEPLVAFFFLCNSQLLVEEQAAPVEALRDRPVHRPLKGYAFDPGRSERSKSTVCLPDDERTSEQL